MPGKITKARWKNVKRDRGMNKTEAAYAAELECQLKADEIQGYGYEPFKLRLADNTTLTPDFAVFTNDGFIELHDIKGSFWPEHNRVKWKVAISEHPWFCFVLVRRAKGKMGGWEFERFE